MSVAHSDHGEIQVHFNAFASDVLLDVAYGICSSNLGCCLRTLQCKLAVVLVAVIDLLAIVPGTKLVSHSAIVGAR